MAEDDNPAKKAARALGLGPLARPSSPLDNVPGPPKAASTYESPSATPPSDSEDGFAAMQELARKRRDLAEAARPLADAAAQLARQASRSPHYWVNRLEREDRKADIANAIEQSSGKATMSESDTSSASTKWVRQFFEFVGLGFLLGPPGFLGEAFLKSEPINWSMMIAIFVGFWAIGGISLAAGLTWPDWRPSNEAKAAVIESLAHSVWVWLSVVFAIAFGPALLVAGFSRPALFIDSPTSSTGMNFAPVAPKSSFNVALPPPGPLSTLAMVDSIAARGNALSPSDFLDHKWAVVITFAKENEYAAQVLRRIVGAKIETIHRRILMILTRQNL
jgi:hypothetical protein